MERGGKRQFVKSSSVPPWVDLVSSQSQPHSMQWFETRHRQKGHASNAYDVFPVVSSFVKSFFFSNLMKPFAYGCDCHLPLDMDNMYSEVVCGVFPVR
jgi:hypothetical protein